MPAVLLSCVSAGAQARARGSANPGVKPVRLMDRAEVRVSRVEIQPGAVRSVHSHEDVRFHLWIPISGKLEITIGSAAPVEAGSGQAFFLQKGTSHGFRNVGTTMAVVMEVFVKDGASSAELERLETGLAALSQR